MESSLKSNQSPELLLFTAQEPDGKIIGVFTVTPPHPIIVFLKNDSHMEEAASPFIHFMLREHIPIYGFVGKKTHVDLLHSVYDKICNPSINFIMQQGVYQLTNLVDLQHASGKMVTLDESSIPFLANCHVHFNQDCQLPAISVTEATKNVTAFIKDRSVFGWQVEGKIVSIAKASRPTKHGITVNFVFTPNEYRRKGYARTLVWHLTTDLTNPTSNKIYKEIGYKFLYKSKHIQYDTDK